MACVGGQRRANAPEQQPELILCALLKVDSNSFARKVSRVGVIGLEPGEFPASEVVVPMQCICAQQINIFQIKKSLRTYTMEFFKILVTQSGQAPRASTLRVGKIWLQPFGR